MKQMQRDPLASTKARKAERKAEEKSGLITIKPVKLEGQPPAGAGGGFKKGGFKSAFGDAKEEQESLPKPSGGFKKAFEEDVPVKDDVAETPEESDTDDEGYEMYDPRFPTD